MEINQNASVDASQIDDARGRGGGGGLAGIPIPTSKGGLIVTVIAVLLALAGGGFGISQLGGGGGGTASDCATGGAGHDNTDCRNELYVESIQAFWKTELPKAYGKTYEMAQTQFFSGQTDTGCGAADSGVGPFYCPEDDVVYIDLSFYDELSTKFGAKGEFAQPYVLAHEYGHHVQDLLGTASQESVSLELQADCFAGVWAKHATETKDKNGQPIFTSITDSDIKEALDAAAAVGDDAIQKKMGGPVDESKFTHGSSAQRDQWFSTGYHSGDPKKCDTFS